MLSKNRLCTVPKIYFKSELSSCPHCESKLVRFHTAWKKKISTLSGVIHAWSMVRRSYIPVQETVVRPPR